MNFQTAQNSPPTFVESFNVEQGQNNWLWRPLRSGNEYEALIPKTNCEFTYKGKGDTFHSVAVMREWVEKYAWQAERLAEVLEKSTLKQTVLSIHDFLYNHFQYKADLTSQLLRSPACAWTQRADGIDCKSYSIIGSCLLLNMGITHYIRQIKQPGRSADDFTHVYLVVPFDQQTGNLKKGYYVIDGTLPGMEECAKLEYSDLKMEGLPHYGLNGVGIGLNGINLSDIARSFSLNKIGLSKIGCIGGSSLDGNGTKVYLANIDTYWQGIVTRINSAITSGNYTEMSKAFSEALANSQIFVEASNRNLKKGWNTCTSDNIKSAIKAHTFYRDVVVNGLFSVYLSKYFDVTGNAGTQQFTSDGAEKRYGFRHLNLSSSQVVTITQPVVNYMPKITVASIPALEFTAYAVNQVTAGQPINAENWISSLQNVIRTFTPPPGSSGDTSGVSDPRNEGSYTIEGQEGSYNGGKPTQQAGMGTIVGVGLATAALFMLFNGGFSTAQKVSNAK